MKYTILETLVSIYFAAILKIQYFFWGGEGGVPRVIPAAPVSCFDVKKQEDWGIR